MAKSGRQLTSSMASIGSYFRRVKLVAVASEMAAGREADDANPPGVDGPLGGPATDEADGAASSVSCGVQEPAHPGIPSAARTTVLENDSVCHGIQPPRAPSPSRSQ